MYNCPTLLTRGNYKHTTHTLLCWAFHRSSRECATSQVRHSVANRNDPTTFLVLPPHPRECATSRDDTVLPTGTTPSLISFVPTNPREGATGKDDIVLPAGTGPLSPFLCSPHPRECTSSKGGTVLPAGTVPLPPFLCSPHPRLLESAPPARVAQCCQQEQPLYIPRSTLRTSPSTPAYPPEHTPV